MRLIPIRALDQTDTEWIKVADTKGCIVFATGTMRPTPTSGQAHCLCVAVKRQVYILLYLLYFIILSTHSGYYLRDHPSENPSCTPSRSPATCTSPESRCVLRRPAVCWIPVRIHHLQLAGRPASPLPRPPRQPDAGLPCLQPS